MTGAAKCKAVSDEFRSSLPVSFVPDIAKQYLDSVTSDPVSTNGHAHGLLVSMVGSDMRGSLRYRHLFLTVVAIVQACETSNPAPTVAGESKGQIEVVAHCVYRGVGTLFGSDPSIQKTLTWNTNHSAANIVVRNPAEVLATYRVEQLADSVKISSEVAHASPDVKTAAAREGQMTRACLDEGGF